jgi:hypothetical protein
MLLRSRKEHIENLLWSDGWDSNPLLVNRSVSAKGETCNHCYLLSSLPVPHQNVTLMADWAHERKAIVMNTQGKFLVVSEVRARVN